MFYKISLIVSLLCTDVISFPGMIKTHKFGIKNKAHKTLRLTLPKHKTLERLSSSPCRLDKCYFWM
jgi:hypothetical protein